MKKLIVGLLIAGLLVVCSCAPSYEPGGLELPTDLPASNGVLIPDSDEAVGVIEPPPELYDRTWISPGKVVVGNFYPGARAEYPVTVHNGNESSCSFTITCRPADHVDEPYVKAPSEVQDWVMIVDPTPVLEPKETKDILVVLEMPEDEEVFAPKWEFWVSVIDTTQGGVVRTELCSRWLVSMR